DGCRPGLAREIWQRAGFGQRERLRLARARKLARNDERAERGGAEQDQLAFGDNASESPSEVLVRRGRQRPDDDVGVAHGLHEVGRGLVQPRRSLALLRLERDALRKRADILRTPSPDPHAMARQREVGGGGERPVAAAQNCDVHAMTPSRRSASMRGPGYFSSVASTSSVCCPSRGAGAGVNAVSPSTLIGVPSVGSGPRRSCSSVTTIPRWRTCGSLSTRSTLWIGAAGTPAPCSRSSQSRVVRSANVPSINDMSATRLATRSPLAAKRGSSAPSGWPAARPKAGQKRAKTATIKSPSRVGSVPYGTTDACADPIGCGTTPSVQKYWARYDSSDTWQSSSERSTCAPRPVCARRSSAPATANAPNRPP